MNRRQRKKLEKQSKLKTYLDSNLSKKQARKHLKEVDEIFKMLDNLSPKAIISKNENAVNRKAEYLENKYNKLIMPEKWRTAFLETGIANSNLVIAELENLDYLLDERLSYWMQGKQGERFAENYAKAKNVIKNDDDEYDEAFNGEEAYDDYMMILNNVLIEYGPFKKASDIIMTIVEVRWNEQTEEVFLGSSQVVTVKKRQKLKINVVKSNKLSDINKTSTGKTTDATTSIMDLFML